MDVTFVCSGEEPFKMEVGFFDTVQDIKQKLQGCKGCPGPAAALSLSHNGDVLADALDGAGAGAGVTERYGIVEGSVIHVALAADDDDVRRHQLQQKTKKNKKPSSKRRPLRVTVVSRCGTGRVEVAVGAGARGAVSALRGELERQERARGDGTAATTSFPLPRDGAYFFIHRQSVMDEARSFEWHGVADGDEVVVFDGSVTRGAPAAWPSLGSA